MATDIFRAGAVLASVSTAVALAGSPAHAEDADQADGRRPLIIVTGQHQGYAVDETTTATKTPTELIDVPQAVSVLSREQLDDQAVQQLGDALRYVPGVVLGQGEGHRDQVTLRGQNTTADFFLDGLRDDTQYYRPLYNVERVEVLRGANAMIFGRGGGGGVINRVSKVADPALPFVHGNAAVDTFGAFDLAVDVNQPLTENAAGRINAIYQELDNHRQAFEGRFIGISPTATVGLGETTALTLGYSYDDDKRVTDRGIPSLAGKPLRGVYDTFFGERDLNRSRVKAHNARARLDAQLTDNLSGNVSALFTDSSKFYANVYPRGATATTVELEGYADGTKRQNFIGQGNLVWTGSTGPIGHTLLVGVEAADQDSDNDRRNVLFAGGTNGGARATVPLGERIAVPATSLTGRIRNSRSRLKVLSAYVQDQVEIGEHLQVVAGIRFDDFDIRTTNVVNGFTAERQDDKWSPRLGVIVKPMPNLSLYASYAKSFLPQAGDQFLVLDATAATLAPETFENVEAGVKWDILPKLSFSAAAYRLDRDNTRAPDPVNPALVVQTGQTRTKGIEVQLTGRITPQWQASLGYALQDGEVRSTTSAAPAGRELAQVPKHQVTAWTRYDVTAQFGLGLGLVHQSRQFATISNAVVLPSVTRVDAAAFWDVTERLALQVNIENLFDEKYYPSAHSDQNISTGEPINARVGVRMRF